MRGFNKGDWCRPMRPWADLPLDRDIRLAAVLAAQAIAETLVHDKKTHVPCACGCGQRIKKFDKSGCGDPWCRVTGRDRADRHDGRSGGLPVRP